MMSMPAFLLAAALCLSGMIALSLAMERHFEQATGRACLTRAACWVLRSTGTLLLLAGLATCVSVWGPTVGFVGWWGILTVGATGTALSLSYWPRWVVPVGVSGCGIAVMIAFAV